MIALALLIAASAETIALRLEDPGEVAHFEARSLLELLAERIEAHSGARVVIDDLVSPCKAADRCFEEIKERTRTGEVVWVKMVKGPRRIHVEAWRGANVGEVNVTRDQAETKARLDELTAELFPEPPIVRDPPPSIAIEPPSDPPIAAIPAPPTEANVSIPVLPIALAGAALITAGVGFGFGASSKSAGDEWVAGPLLRDQYESLRDREESHATIANVCWVTAAILLAGAGVSWWLEAP